MFDVSFCVTLSGTCLFPTKVWSFPGGSAFQIRLHSSLAPPVKCRKPFPLVPVVYFGDVVKPGWLPYLDLKLNPHQPWPSKRPKGNLQSGKVHMKAESSAFWMNHEPWAWFQVMTQNPSGESSSCWFRPAPILCQKAGKATLVHWRAIPECKIGTWSMRMSRQSISFQLPARRKSPK